MQAEATGKDIYIYFLMEWVLRDVRPARLYVAKASLPDKLIPHSISCLYIILTCGFINFCGYF